MNVLKEIEKNSEIMKAHDGEPCEAIRISKLSEILQKAKVA